MLLITPSQCRAARALLNWSQPDLAGRCGVHVQTISAFEQETSTPTKRTLEKIAVTLEAAGAELLPNEGVSKKSQSEIKIYKDKVGFAAFRQNVLIEARKGPIDICVSNVDERLFDFWGSDGVNSAFR